MIYFFIFLFFFTLGKNYLSVNHVVSNKPTRYVAQVIAHSLHDFSLVNKIFSISCTTHMVNNSILRYLQHLIFLFVLIGCLNIIFRLMFIQFDTHILAGNLGKLGLKF